ncbi:hypothetical protein [Lactococcus cremoris]|uniref:Uncharacterized protein n=2 Tax=Lactococcus lactis subsp. cremoris TaxID=1359 RepID=A0A2A5SPH7_LACLC|nr:hypothetical protein [Lactococcus cremoris]KGH34426.1 hypothetical protein JL36_00765 [Lactococcus cremoris]PCS15842.1 hypothetical protein RU92_GL001170 [Lactococcus cremoris subsp. tructae]QSE64526.1 hypothetical protein JWR96_05275 [Lactococcus cremoris]WMX70222.1 hypothetical protein RF668_10000 [Lactococcus cremoris]
MKKLITTKNIPTIYNILEINSNTEKLEILVDIKEEHIKPEINFKIIFSGVLDFRFANEHGFLRREELKERNYNSGILYEVNNSDYLKYYLSMFPASDYIHPKIKHYFLMDETGNYGIDVLMDSSYGEIETETVVF